MGKTLVAACLLFAAACQPMYKDTSEPLRNPGKVRAPAVATTEPDPTFVDTCNVNFTARPTQQRKAPESQQLTVQGNSALQPVVAKTARPNKPSDVRAVQDAIDKYRAALIKDPYNAEATLKLALAYDRVLRKGCALAMLRRLETLAANPTFEPDARPMIELVGQNPHWFRPYHNDARAAVGL